MPGIMQKTNFRTISQERSSWCRGQWPWSVDQLNSVPEELPWPFCQRHDGVLSKHHAELLPASKSVFVSPWLDLLKATPLWAGPRGEAFEHLAPQSARAILRDILTMAHWLQSFRRQLSVLWFPQDLFVRHLWQQPHFSLEKEISGEGNRGRRQPEKRSSE